MRSIVFLIACLELKSLAIPCLEGFWENMSYSDGEEALGEADLRIFWAWFCHWAIWCFEYFRCRF